MKKDCLIRALKTFVQAFLGVVAAEAGAIIMGITDWTDLKAVGAAFAPMVIAALSAGFSAVWNMLLLKHCEKLDTNGK